MVGLAYNVLGLAVVGSLLLYFFREWPMMSQVKTFIYNFCIAPFVYVALPVVGPAAAFPGFPWVYPKYVEMARMLIHSDCNCIPSVHFSTALLVCFFCRKSTIGCCVSIVLVVLTFLSTLGFGQHYLFDLLCSLPYTCLVLWLGLSPTPGKPRYGCMRVLPCQ